MRQWVVLHPGNSNSSSRAMARTATLAERIANPTQFMGLSGWVLPWISGLAAATIAGGLWLGFSAPPDYQQGETVRIMFIEVDVVGIHDTRA